MPDILILLLGILLGLAIAFGLCVWWASKIQIY